MPTDDDWIEAELAALARDDAPLEAPFRARLLADAPRSVRRRWHVPLPRLAGLAGLPAATLAGLWIGLAQPDMVIGLVPGPAVADDALLGEVFGEVFGTGWIDLEDGT